VQTFFSKLTDLGLRSTITIDIQDPYLVRQALLDNVNRDCSATTAVLCLDSLVFEAAPVCSELGISAVGTVVPGTSADVDLKVPGVNISLIKKPVRYSRLAEFLSGV
jgi:hypothetical protein